MRLITSTEDGVKHCAMNILYSLRHLGYTIPPQADAGWIGEAGPGPSYLDPASGCPDNDFTNRHTTFMTWNLLHLARMLNDAGIPVDGDQRNEWDAGCRFDFENPEGCRRTARHAGLTSVSVQSVLTSDVVLFLRTGKSPHRVLRRGRRHGVSSSRGCFGTTRMGGNHARPQCSGSEHTRRRHQ